jgi:hypothetical protein
MLKKIAAFAVVAMIAGTAFAQQTVATAQDGLRNAGIDITIPADATQDQIDRILAILGAADFTPEEATDQIKEILGIQ